MLTLQAFARSCTVFWLGALLPLAALAQDQGSTGSGGETGSTGDETGSSTGSGSGGSYDSPNSYNLGGGTVTLASAILNGGTVSNGTLDVSAQIDARSGSVSAQLAGSGYMVKTTTGTLELSGNHTFTGSVNILAGTLSLNGTIGDGAVFWVSDGGRLAGSGTIDKPASVFSGGAIAPGNSPGSLTFTQGLAFQGGTVLDFEIGTASDELFVTGGLLTGPESGVVTINLSDAGGASPGTYTLIDATGATLNSIGATSFNIASAPVGWSTSLVFDGDKLQLNLSAIPEPASAAALGAGTAVAVIAWRRRRRRARRAG